MLRIKQIPGIAASSRILIVGLGETGLSVARFLAPLDLQLAVADSREQPPCLEQMTELLPDVALFLGPFDQHVFDNADVIVVSPGVAISTPQIQAAVDKGVPVIGDIELFARVANAPVVVITGSNGKSTVTTLLGQVAEANGLFVAVGGNLGEPALNLLDTEVALYILELSSFQLETTSSLKPLVASVLNISADHMDRYPGIDEYANVKSSVYDNAEVGIYNADDPRVMAMQKTPESRCFTLQKSTEKNTFGITGTDDQTWLSNGSSRLMLAADLLLRGKHNQANALAVLAMADALTLDTDITTSVIKHFVGLPHRTEFVDEINQIVWINDSKATNVGACIAALEGLHHGDDSRTVLIAGGDCKDAEFSALLPVVKTCTRAIILIGKDAGLLEQVLKDQVPLIMAKSMAEAVTAAADTAAPGDRVLLAPACASFDMFRNYQHRGEVFVSMVKELLK